jgi:predicted GTPase
LKSKDKDQPTIAAREKSEENTEAKMNILSNKDTKEVPVTTGTFFLSFHPLSQFIFFYPFPDTGAQQMLTPITLITSHAQVNPQAFDQVIVEQNSDFLVVAVIGTKSVGKSTILNLLLTELGNNPVETIFKEKEGVFKMKSRKHNFSTLPVTEGIK